MSNADYQVRRNAAAMYLTTCRICGGRTSKAFARKNDNRCKRCTDPAEASEQSAAKAQRDYEHGLYLDCGPQAWDDR